MKPTFKNLLFEPKKYDKKCIGATLELKPKVFISVVAGPGLYSLPGGSVDAAKRDKMPDYPDSNYFTSFESIHILNLRKANLHVTSRLRTTTKEER